MGKVRNIFNLCLVRQLLGKVHCNKFIFFVFFLNFLFFLNFKIFNSYMHSQTWTPPPTSLPTTSLWVIPMHQPQASCTLRQTWTGDSILTWQYTCYNSHSPKSSHPLTLPLSPKVRYTHLCLFSCLAYRVVIAIFLMVKVLKGTNIKAFYLESDHSSSLV